jgi:hypothetical protein
MTSFRIRPKFEVISEKSKEHLIKEIKDKALHPNRTSECDVLILKERIKLKIKKEDQHYWSPVLTVYLYEEEDGGTLLRGRYGPHQNVWTLFTLLYLALSILFLFVSIYGFSRMSLGLSYQVLWILPVLLGIAILLYLSSQIGQKLGAEETFTLHHFFEELLDQKIHIG